MLCTEQGLVDGCMLDPVVSVIMPAFNAGEFIHRAIASTKDQDCGTIEVIVIDDASTDDTVQRVTDLALGDERIRLIRHASNLGPAAARNTGINAARGTWLAILDADDRFEKRRLKNLLSAADQTNSDMVADNLDLREFSSDCALGLAFDPAWMQGVPLTLRDLALKDDVSAHECYPIGYAKPVFRTSFIRYKKLFYDPNHNVAEDYLFYCNCVLAGARFTLFPQSSYLYSIRTGSLSSAKSDHKGTLKSLHQMRAVNNKLLTLVPLQHDAWKSFKIRGNSIEFRLLKLGIDSRSFELIVDGLGQIELSYLFARVVTYAIRSVSQFKIKCL